VWVKKKAKKNPVGAAEPLEKKSIIQNEGVKWVLTQV
jgi:hypothetical protein